MDNILDNLPEISFIENLTLNDVVNDMAADYEMKLRELKKGNTKLHMADEMRFLLNASAVQIYQTMMYCDEMGKRQLLKYSSGDYLDHLGGFKNISRDEEKAAAVTVRFALAEPRGTAVSIPVGTRVTNDSLYFETTEYSEIIPGDTFIDIIMYCTDKGEGGNGVLPGEINTLVTPIPYIHTVDNISESVGGCEREGDESFAQKIYLAPSGYSTAGPTDAYEYHTKKYSPEITDVKVASPEKGVVEIRFIKNYGDIPEDAELKGLEVYLDNKEKRPLTDHVIVKKPESSEYSVNVEYYIHKGKSGATVELQNNIEEAVREYIRWQSSAIGRDIDPSVLIRLMSLAGAVKINVTEPDYIEIDNITVPTNVNCRIEYKGLKDD